MKARIATIRGTFAVPGVSRNNRWYKPEHIAGAVAEAQSLIDSGDAPVVAMLTHHGARDPRSGDVTRTAGRVTKVSLSPEGHGLFEADIADTEAGHDVASLTLPDKPYLKGVSMASVWKGVPRMEPGPHGEMVETADGFSLRGIDFTHNPGVPGAEIHSAEIAETSEEGLILESLDEVQFEADAKPYGDVAYADPGYQKDGQKRYPIDTAAHVRAAWSYVNQAKNASAYTDAQLKRIKSKIKSAAGKFGIDIAQEAELLALVLEDLSEEALEAYASQQPDDDQMESCAECNADLPPGANYCPECGTQVPPTESVTTQKGATMPTEATPTGEATESAPARNLTDADIEALAAVLKPVESAPAETATETPAAPVESAPVTYTQEQVDAMLAAKAPVESAPAAPAAEVTETLTKDDARALITEALEAQRAQFVEEFRSTGSRKGLIPKHILEQAPEEIYGAEADLSKASTRDLEKLTDAAFSPLLAR